MAKTIGYNVDLARLEKLTILSKNQNKPLSSKMMNELSELRAAYNTNELDLPKDRLEALSLYIRELHSGDAATTADLARLNVIEYKLSKL
tara:strand:+ start:519 stop:788 length:270 start_codon:yes stop_codon:yes gene_type:complete